MEGNKPEETKEGVMRLFAKDLYLAEGSDHSQMMIMRDVVNYLGVNNIHILEFQAIKEQVYQEMEQHIGETYFYSLDMSKWRESPMRVNTETVAESILHFCGMISRTQHFDGRIVFALREIPQDVPQAYVYWIKEESSVKRFDPNKLK